MSNKQHERSHTGFGSECKSTDIWDDDNHWLLITIWIFRRYSKYWRRSGHLWLDSCCTVLCYVCINISLITLRDSESKLIDWINSCLFLYYLCFDFVVLFPVGRPRIWTCGDYAFRSHTFWWCQRTRFILRLTLCRFDHQSRSPNE